ncbi:MAG: hypothetical protein GXP49_00720 [Deltaproteobacteria bacterium]|nr:hypothetical protein [Deltaproteobacteria bacterium]
MTLLLSCLVLVSLEFSYSVMDSPPSPTLWFVLALLSAGVALASAFITLCIYSYEESSTVTELLLFSSFAILDLVLNTWPLSYPFAEVGIDISLIGAAATGGRLLARVVEDLRRALPVCLIIAVVDTWSVMAPGGVTKKLVETFQSGESRTLGLLLFSFPLPGGGAARLGVGVTDLVFASAFIYLLVKAEKKLFLTVFAMLLACIAALSLGMLLASPVPVLPFLALAFWIVNRKEMKLNRKEKLELAVFLVLLAAFLAGLSYLRS